MSPDQQHTLIVIAGPTAIGKSAVAMELARKLGTDIISADSRQCYREMTIGTAKPSKEELAEVKHYFTDCFPVTDNISAAGFEDLALGYLDTIFQKAHTAILCGGTGLYIKAVCEGLDDMPKVDEQIAEEINEAYKHKGREWLQEAIAAEDPEFYAQGEIQNPARLIRALVFKRSTGQSILHYRSGNKKQRDFKIIKIGLELPREHLYARINKRVDAMMQAGLLEEVKSLYPLRELKNLQTVGYVELRDYLDGKYSLEEAVDKIKQHTRNYAKRQMTWFKKDEGMQFYRADDADLVKKILSAV